MSARIAAQTTAEPVLADDWKQQLQAAITDPLQLLQALGLDGHQHRIDAHSGFALRVPQAYVAKMQHGDPHDPLLLQVLPQLVERQPGGQLDPVADSHFMPAPGLLHKYHGRALLITTGACAIHCRYCFRRHYPYNEAGLSRARLQQVLSYLQQHEETDEVILSGGDPLVLDDRRLSALIEALEAVPHLRYLRFHTRLPVVLPARINSALIALLQRSRFRITLVVHCNHANEIAAEEGRALARLQSAGITLLNQSVLLKGINDDADTLAALSKRLYDHHVLPYYLHCLDPVQGGMHFEVGEQRAIEIIDRLRARLPGYLLPRLVREIPHSASKTAIFPI